jgi:peptidyl-prolyl cis-trans isomerase A (cyclophilin A)
MLRRLLPVFVMLILISACSKTEQTAQPEPSGTPAAQVSAPAAPATGNPLLDPKSPAMNQTAPAKYQVRFSTSKGDFTLDVDRTWAPKGADRFYNLVKNGYFDNVRFYRVIQTPRPFMVQFGINGDPAIAAKWGDDTAIEDDPVTQSNTRGTITFATKGPNTRTTEVYINFGDNAFLDSQGFSPFGKVAEGGMDVVDKLNAEYGEAGSATGPDPFRIAGEGNEYLTKNFPNMDYIKTARVAE